MRGPGEGAGWRRNRLRMKTIVVSAAKNGHVNQCLAVCEAAGWRPDEVVRIPAPGRMTPWVQSAWLRFRRRLATVRALPRRREGERLRIVASGAASERIVAGYRALYGDDLFAAFSGRPSWGTAIFDVALVPRHSLSETESAEAFRVPGARRTVLRRGVPVRTRPAPEDGGSGVLFMIGGVNKAFDLEPARIVQQVGELLQRGADGPFTMAFSRRTPVATESALRAALKSSDVAFLDRRDQPGFQRALLGAAGYVVTPDSLTMLCEACNTGRPTLVFDLRCFDPSSTTARCVRDLLDGGEVALAPDGRPNASAAGAFVAPAAALEAYSAWNDKTAKAL